MKIAERIKNLAKLPKSLNGFTPRVGVDEKLILCKHIFGLGIFIYKIRKKKIKRGHILDL